MTRRPRMRDDLFELFEEKKDHKNQGIDEILLEEFPELEDELKKRKQEKRENLFTDDDDSLMDTDLF